MLLTFALTLLLVNTGTTIYAANKVKMNRVLAVLASVIVPIPFLIPVALIAGSTVSKAIKNHFNPPPTATEQEIQKINEIADRNIAKFYEKAQSNIAAYDKLDQALDKINSIRDKQLNAITTPDGKKITAEMKNFGRIDQNTLLKLCREGGAEYAMSQRQKKNQTMGQSKLNNSQSQSQTKSSSLKR